jgi:hypothetical protein
MFEIS